MQLTESHVAEAALEWFGKLGYAFVRGPEMAPGETGAERDLFEETVLEGRLREALRRLNPRVPEEAGATMKPSLPFRFERRLNP